MSGFQSPNYTQTPNDLFDELLPNMGLAELKVVLCIVRYTFGFHREEIKLSIRTIAEFTGLNVNSVMEGARQAEEHGLIERSTDGNKTTIWRAVVSVLPTKTRRLRSSDASVLSTETLLGVKEKEIKNKEDSIFQIYESNIGPLTPMIADSLTDAEKTYPLDWIKEAIALSVENNKRNWRYCETILKRWQADGKDSGRGNGQKAAQPSEYPTL